MAFKRLNRSDRYTANYDQAYSQQKGQSASQVKPVSPAPPTSSFSVPIEEHEEQTRQRFNIPKSLWQAIPAQESGGNWKAKSPTGVRGKYQVTQDTAKGLGFNRDDPYEQTTAAAAYLRQNYDRLDGVYADENDRWLGAAAMYYGGPGAIQKGGKISNKSLDGLSTPRRYVKQLSQKMKQVGSSEGAAMPMSQTYPSFNALKAKTESSVAGYNGSMPAFMQVDTETPPPYFSPLLLGNQAAQPSVQPPAPVRKPATKRPYRTTEDEKKKIEIVTTNDIPPDLRNLLPPMPKGWKTDPSLIPVPAATTRPVAAQPAIPPGRPIPQPLPAPFLPEAQRSDKVETSPLRQQSYSSGQMPQSRMQSSTMGYGNPSPPSMQPGTSALPYFYPLLSKDRVAQIAPPAVTPAPAAASQPPVRPRSQPQAAVPVTPLIPQLPAAASALKDTREPSGPLEVLPNVNPESFIDRSRGYPTYNKQQMMGINPLTRPTSEVMAPTESERAMEAYAAQRAARNGGEAGMTSIDRARETYINQGARPVLDVNRPGAPVVAKQNRGFGEILKTAGVGALQGLAAGGLGGAIGGALTGGIIQAASPEMGRGVRFDTLQRPRLERQQQQQIAEIQRQQQGRLAEAQIGNLESQAFERQAELALKAAEARRREKSVTLSGDETMFERDPQTGRLVPVATNPRQRFQTGGGNDDESQAFEIRREDGAYKQASVVEGLKAEMNRYGNDITDKASGFPQYREAKQKYEAEYALLMQRYGDLFTSEPVNDQYGNVMYNLKARNRNQRTPLLSPEEQKKAQAKKPASSQIAPRPKSALADLLNR